MSKVRAAGAAGRAGGVVPAVCGGGEPGFGVRRRRGRGRANLPAALEMLKGQTIADVPIVLTAIDPCFGCMDRMSFLDTETNRQWTWSGEQLRQYGIKYYKDRR